MAEVILASQSPRRRMLLEQLGITCDVVPANIDETRTPGEQPEQYVARLAQDKAVAGRRLSPRTLAVVGADTCVCVDDLILGKPADALEARDMLQKLNGRRHRVITGVAVVAAGANRCHGHRVSVSQVEMRAIPQWEIDAYCATGEPFDKAGGYAIQGLAGVFVASISGSYSGIVGLPLFDLAALLSEVGVTVWDNPAKT